MAAEEEHPGKKIRLTRSTLLALSGFSGTGKTSIREQILKKISGSRFSLSVTTRPPRKHERDGTDYQFVSSEMFDSMVKNNELLEWEEVHGNFYGTPLKPVEEVLKKPGLIIFDVDVYGGVSIKQRFPETILVFLEPPSLEVLRERLILRHTDSPEEIERRMQRIPKEQEMSKHYDHIVTNHSIEQAADEICEIIRVFQDK